MIGKTFLSSIYCVVRCILYPGTKIVIASGTRGQSTNVLEKIMLELHPASKELACEIDDKQTKMNGTNAQVVFKNSSYIKVVTASDSARGSRANVLLLDEARLLNKTLVDTVLRKFLTQRRMPRYSELSPSDRDAARAREKNITLYLTSAYSTDSWMYAKCETTAGAMLNPDKTQFICGLPYQLSITEGLLDPDIVADDMMEADFSQPKFDMEYSALWWGSGEDTFFDFNSIARNRKIQYPMLPNKLAAKVGNSASVKIQPKSHGEIRILSADIALMSSRKHNNDATAIFINQMTKTKTNRYTSNIIYTEVSEGLRTDEQALLIRRLYDEYQCDYIVLDCQGVGMGVYDALVRDISDPDTGEIYPAISCYNNSEMASRCTVPGADKVIWAIKASAQFNSDCAFLLREAFRSGRIRLLVSEYDGEVALGEIKGFKSLSPSEKVRLTLPYINTTLLIDELVNLQHEETGGRVKIYEKSGMRKDRYSSLAYNYYVATEIEKRENKRQSFDSDDEDKFIMRPPKHGGRSGKVVNSIGGRAKQGWW